jgi:pimeloyl-ACP methyl ester carboxylesterase
MKKCDRSYFFGPENKRLFVQEWGDENKPVIFLVHGFPGCGEHGKLMSMSPLWNSFRLIAVDRPGYGESIVQKGLTPLKFAKQIQSLFLEKNIQDLSVISVSGGAPYAMAVAYLMGSRVKKVTSIGGIAPLTVQNFQYMNSLQKKTWFVRNFLPTPVIQFALDRVWQKGLAKIEEALFTNIRSFSPPDREVFSHPDIQPILRETTHRALQQGPAGLLHDMKVYSKHWGFPLNGITCPVTLWHGSQDDIVHPRFAQDMKRNLPRATLNFIENEGHYSILMNKRDEIIADVLAF